MANSNYGVTSSGFLLPTFDDILQDVQDDFRSEFPALSFEENKLETALSRSFSSLIECFYSDLFDVYNSQNPQFAQGCKLDIIANRNGVSRIDGESDSNLRDRISTILSGSGGLSGEQCFDRLYTDLLSINGVTQVQINLNDTQFQSGPLPPNSYEVMVLGGDESEIAAAIWNRHPVGITHVGSTSATIVDCFGQCRSIPFTRPKLVPIYLDIRVNRTQINCGCPADDTSVIKESIANYLDSEQGVCFTRVGQPVNIQEFFPAIFSIQGIGISCALLSRDGECATRRIVTLKRDEVPFFDPNCCNVEFTPASASPCATGVFKCPPDECTFTLGITKTPSVTTFSAAGVIIDYTYVVTNNGSVPLYQPITITDDKAVVTCDSIPLTGLPVGDSVTCTASYETTFEDAIAGFVTNKAQAVSGNNFSRCIEATVVYNGPELVDEITLSKALIDGDCTAVGNVLTYEYVITNTGMVPITGQPVINDDKISGIICPPLPSGGLLPNDSIAATAETIVTQDIIDAGECCNTARAVAFSAIGQVISNSVTVCVQCSEEGLPPTAPDGVLITDCGNAFPYQTNVWVDDTGAVTLTDNGGAAALGLLFTDNGDNTATLSVNGNLSNGTIIITGTDGDGEASTQEIIVNCDSGFSTTAFINSGEADDGAFPEPTPYCGFGGVPNGNPIQTIGSYGGGSICGAIPTRAMISGNVPAFLYLDFDVPLDPSITEITIGTIVVPISGGQSSYVLPASFALNTVMCSDFTMSANCS